MHAVGEQYLLGTGCHARIGVILHERRSTLNETSRNVQEQAPAGINIWVNRGNTRRMPEYSSRRVDVSSIAISNRHLDITLLRVSLAAP